MQPKSSNADLERAAVLMLHACEFVSSLDLTIPANQARAKSLAEVAAKCARNVMP